MPKIKFEKTLLIGSGTIPWYMKAKRWAKNCLLYTSDAADE